MNLPELWCLINAQMFPHHNVIAVEFDPTRMVVQGGFARPDAFLLRVVPVSKPAMNDRQYAATLRHQGRLLRVPSNLLPPEIWDPMNRRWGPLLPESST